MITSRIVKRFMSFSVALAAPLTIFAQIYKDPNVSVEKRVSDLLSRMTLEESLAVESGRIRE